ncbi:MAG TPA: beta-N-acetylglucosaminidase domain-containing protein, partial [Jatrophihabitans sp.]|nr:beta-N-acetylglucosaminidase domain-containing protein [Jatrophihabitans sp.]
YAGTAASPYRAGLASTLPADALVLWSGPSVVSASVSAADVEAAERAFGRRLVLWDNVPVNDFDRSRLYVGPLRGRPASSRLAGLLANPMIEPAASRLTLATAAEYARDPAGYDADAALDRALATEAGPDAGWLRDLAGAADWPPDADTGSALRPFVPAGADGDTTALRARLAPPAALPLAAPRSEAGREVEPWRRAARDFARAGLAACDLLSGAGAPAEVRAALDRAEAHWPNALRDVLSPFVRASLPPGWDRAGTPYALFVGAPVPTAGEERLIALLRGRGLAVRRGVDPAEPPALVVVSRSADERDAVRAAALPVPLLALFHLVPLGLARASGVFMRESRVVVTAPGHALAGGRSGAVEVYRGPAMTRWCEPGAGATVVARAEEEPRPVIVHYPAGARLANGDAAPAARAVLFLGRDLLAPWVITPDGVALADAAIGALLGS